MVSRRFPLVLNGLLFLFALAAAHPTAKCAEPQADLAVGKEASFEKADFVLLGGRVHTLDGRNSVTEAVAVRDEKIVYVGTDAGAERFIGSATVVHRARGKTVIPGINETHVHPLGIAREEVVQPFRQLGSIAEIQAWVRKRAAELPPGEWVRLPRVDVTRVRERRLPTRADLDTAAPERPVVLVWEYANRQRQVLNSAALRVAGITRETPAPKVGRILKNDQGEPTGILEDAPSLTARWLPVRQPSESQVLDSLADVLRQYARLGITSITDRAAAISDWRSYEQLREQHRLLQRVTVTLILRQPKTPAEMEQAIRKLPFKPAQGDDHLRIGPLKIGVDGGVLYGTALLREPYGPQSFSLYGLTDPQYRGKLQVGADVIHAFVRTGHELGWQLSSHVTGDGGVDLVLDAVAAVHQQQPIEKRRFTLIHAYFANPATASRAARLGVCVDTQPAWYYKDGDALADALGAARLRKFIGVNVWRQAGVKVALNSDHFHGVDPDASLNPYNPFLTLYTAITRKTETGLVIGPEERISRETALRLMTEEAAWLHFDERKKGTLELGKYGDMAVLSGDFFSCPEEELKSLRAVLTVVGGRVIYREPQRP